MFKPDRSSYDSIEGITRSLKHYPHFHEMLAARRSAYQEKGEELNSFIVLKAFALDRFGQLGKLRPSPKEVFKNLPEVMDIQDFYERIKGTDFAVSGFCIVNAPVYLPPLNIKCAGCDKYYDTSDCHDVSVWRTAGVGFDFDTSDFVGRQLWEFRRWLQNDHDVHLYIEPSMIIRNDRFINNEVEPYYDSTSPINRNGWVGTEDGITDAYVIQPGDVTQYHETQYFHQKCFIPWMAERSKFEFEDVLSRVGFQEFTMVAVENEYGSFDYRGSWFVVTTPEGSFTIGWRKRVIQIVLHDWPINLGELFSSEQVTVDQQLVHAWSSDNAVEYLKAILAAMAKEPA